MNRVKGVVLAMMALLLALPAWAGTLADNGDGTVTDRATGLMWQQATAGPLTWQAALASCEGLELAGHTDWRLPSREELRSLVDYSIPWPGPTIDTTAFPGTQPSVYWSATTYAYLTYVAWLVGFDDGDGGSDGRSYSYYVRAVRAGQCLGHLPTVAPPHTLAAGTVATLRWNPGSLGGQVTISLSREGGKSGTFETIASGVDNSGTYAWTVSGPTTVNGLLQFVPSAAPDQVTTQGLFAIVPSITLGSLDQAYDGTPKPATATTNPLGLTVTFTYDGSATPPTSVGSYAVVATITDPNYQVTASGTLVIAKGSATVTLGGLNQTYDGTPKPATATTTPTGHTVTFTYDGSETPPTNVGSYAVVGTISDPNYQGSASATLVIDPAPTTTTTLPASGSGFVDNGDGTVTDSRTGLTWMRCEQGMSWTGATCTGTAASYTWDEAMALTQTFAGQSDWRLPTIRELQTIVDRSHYGPALDPEVFPGASTSSLVWSSSPFAESSSYTWYVSFYSGAAGTIKNYSLGVRLVRGGHSLGLLSLARPDSDYTDNGDGTVTHTPTGLTWKHCSEGMTWTGSSCTGAATTYTWDQAMALPPQTYAGQSDWRLPTEGELLSLVDYYKAYHPSINTAIFPGTPSSYVWSSSPYANYSDYAWYVFFQGGSASGSDKSGSYGVRLVRGGQALEPLPTTTSTSTTTTSTPSTTTTTTTPSAIIMPVSAGWNLLSSTIAIPVATVIGQNSAITSAWAWVNGTWAVYLPGETNQGSYAAAKGFQQLGTISPGMGFWVNADGATSLTISGTPSLGALALTSGWNLVGLRSSLSSPVGDIVSGNNGIISIWKWEGGKWSVFLPGEGNHGAYAASKWFGTLDVINSGEGFWVNKQ